MLLQAMLGQVRSWLDEGRREHVRYRYIHTESGRTLSKDEAAAFDKAFDKFDEAFEELGKVFKSKEL